MTELPPRQIQPPVQQHPLCVHLVDDDPMWRYLAGTALGERGWRVQDFDSGATLLEAVARQSPDIVLIDAVMPQMDGFETCRRLRLAMPDVPILMLTSLEDESSIRSAYSAGADDFFIKSMHWSLLGERIRHLVRIADMGRALNRSNDHLARLHTSVRTGSFDFDLRSRRLRGSPGSFCVLGFEETRTELHEKEFRQVLDLAQHERLRDIVERACRAGEPFETDLVLCDANGAE